MPAILLHFDQALNSSIQIGDTAYSVPTNGIDIFDVSNISNITELGIVENISIGPPGKITVNYTGTAPPLGLRFIMFSKDNAVNMSSILGYYAEVKFINKSSDKIELFSVGSQISASSK
jgi:hypothetical protein